MTDPQALLADLERQWQQPVTFDYRVYWYENENDAPELGHIPTQYWYWVQTDSFGFAIDEPRGPFSSHYGASSAARRAREFIINEPPVDVSEYFDAPEVE